MKGEKFKIGAMQIDEPDRLRRKRVPAGESADEPESDLSTD